MSELKKPVITKEQAEAIQFLRSGGNDWTDDDILEHHVTSKWFNEYVPLNNLYTIVLAAALINGYEVEKTPEEKVREYYAANYQRHEQSMPRSKDDFYTSGVAEGVRNTLDSLGIKIEGVNA
ncbi:DUF1642 domain-containing protein [Bacillus paralicheniformis]|uniref:DUF1642 domain-containing protein n=2 Tax=Bacillus subtilis group TaxID=653685 RepID=A0AAW6KH45_9BACI|nr:DUF1642 domain-containing protein [Bacillus paralicheniformis]MDE1383263.1 DUF1642 domain-containing protein [Bacillus paralicheniformis]MDE1454442.1 DUF1642 domain-containing protein [Bacillus paralicheniformis]